VEATAFAAISATAVMSVALQHPEAAGSRVTATHVAAAPAAFAPTAAGVSGQAIAELAHRQVGKDCRPYRDGAGTSACSEDWCVVFAGWVWRQAGVPEAPTSAVATDAAVWGRQRGLFKPRPAGGMGDPRPGDLVVFGEPGAGTGGHVGIVYSVNANGTITTINGDYGGKTPTTTRVVEQTINPVTAVSGTHNWHISGYVSPPDGTPPPPGKYWVNTFAPATGYSSTSEHSVPQGILNAGHNYVLCRKWGDDKQVGNAYNHWWLLTDLDHVDPGKNGRAWVSAYYLSHQGNDQAKDTGGQDIPNC
jgi:hypothetical protein